MPVSSMHACLIHACLIPGSIRIFRTFAAGTVSTVLLNYYDCTAFKRCQHFVSDAPTPSPTGMPMAEAPEQEGENRAADADEEE